jgi:hypothetical protein
VLGIEPAPWQMEFLRAPRGASIIALTVRRPARPPQLLGRLRFACCLRPGSLWVFACPAQRQSGEAVRRVHDIFLKMGIELKSDH